MVMVTGTCAKIDGKCGGHGDILVWKKQFERPQELNY
jgi:hypothetical protein